MSVYSLVFKPTSAAIIGSNLTKLKGSRGMRRQTLQLFLRRTGKPTDTRSGAGFLTAPTEQTSRLGRGVLTEHRSSSGRNCSPPLTSKELVVNPRWLMAAGERLRVLSITIHQLFLSSPASVPVTPCLLQPVEMWMGVTLEVWGWGWGVGGAHSNYTPQDKLYCTPVSSSKT